MGRDRETRKGKIQNGKPFYKIESEAQEELDSSLYQEGKKYDPQRLRQKGYLRASVKREGNRES